jgi:chromosome segregation ATPase
VHCVLVRLASGWRIRDCSGRATRVNGKAVHDEPLRNGDTIQVGTFSFEAQLPATLAHIPTGNAGPVIDRLQRSRRRLAELALGLRRRLQDEAGQQAENEAEVERHRADVELMERRLRQMHQDHVAKQAKLEELDTKLARRAEELEALSKQVQMDAKDHLAQLEADLVAQRIEQNREAERLTQWQQDLQARQAELEAAAARLSEPAGVERDEPEAERLAKWQQDLQARQAEMEATAAQVDELLCRERDQVDRDREQVAREREYLSKERAEVMQLRAEFERARDMLSAQTPVPPTSSRETKLETGPGARLESARKLLRDLADRRKGELTAKKSRSRQVRPPVEGAPE